MSTNITFDLVSWRIGPQGYTHKVHIVAPPGGLRTLCGRAVAFKMLRREPATPQTALNPDALCRECLLLLATRPRAERVAGEP